MKLVIEAVVLVAVIAALTWLLTPGCSMTRPEPTQSNRACITNDDCDPLGAQWWCEPSDHLCHRWVTRRW